MFTMSWLRYVSLLCLLTGLASGTRGAAEGNESAPQREWSISELEGRIREIDLELARLPYFTLRGGVGAIGYQTSSQQKGTRPQSISISWSKPQKIDEIIIVPVIRRSQVNHYEAAGFPVRFSVFCGTSDPGNEQLVAKFSEADDLLPRIAPLTIPCKDIEASWIRIDTAQLSRNAYNNLYILQLAEIMVFSGERDIALQGTAWSSDDRPTTLSWHPRNLVDGFIPYLMDSAFGAPSPAVVSTLGEGRGATFSIDLKDTYTIDRIHLHAPMVGDTLPYMFDSRFAIPRWLQIEGANTPDFSDSTTLLQFKHSNAYSTGPIIMRNIEPTSCRYVRLIAKRPYLSGNQGTRFGFAEVELFSGDKNVALGKPVSANFGLDFNVKSTAPLTDGRNLYGNILPIRTWLNELALRHELEKERPRVAEELNRRYARQKIQLTWAIRLAISLGIAILFGLLIEWSLRQRAIHKTRERIAADIHDELGANLHAIGLLGNLARILKDKPDEQDDILTRLQAMAKRSGQAARYCTNTLEAKELYEDIVEDMRRTTDRLAGDLEHELRFKGEEFLRQLKLRRRIDLFLFYKECLTNVIRHSGASRVITTVRMTKTKLAVTVCDNGRGTGGTVPASLRRRARLFRAKINITIPEAGGTCIQLTRTIRPPDLNGRKPS